jgi:hypothetical protein
MASPVVPPNDKELERLRGLARLLDTAVGIPGTRIRVGLDAILGLIPGGGDIAGAALSGVIVLVALRNGVPPAVLWRMVGNVAVDTVIGAIPLLGDLFDVAWKANTKNVQLLEQFTEQPQTVTTRSRVLGILVAVVALFVLIGLGALGFLAARAIWQLLTA